MTALEIRLILYGAAILALLGGSAWLGYHFTAAHYERVIAADKAAQALALQDAQQHVIAAQQAQAEATQKAETEYADLKQNYDSLGTQLARSVSELTQIHRLVLPATPSTPAQPDAGAAGASGDTELASAAGRAAQACLDDSAHLAALEAWISALK